MLTFLETLLLLLLSCLTYKSAGVRFDLTFNFTLSGGCSGDADASDVLSLRGRYRRRDFVYWAYFSQCFTFNRSEVGKNCATFETNYDISRLRFLWIEHGACPVTITHGVVQVLNHNDVHLDFCSKANSAIQSKVIAKPQTGAFYLTGYCLIYNAKTCDSSSDQTTCIISEPTSSSTSNTSAELTPLSLTSLPLAASSQLPEPSGIISSSLSSSQSLPLSPSLPSIVNSPISISDSSDFSLLSIQSPSATSSMPTSVLSYSSSTTSSMHSLSYHSIIFYSMSTSILSSASQLDSTSSLPTSVLSYSSLNALSMHSLSYHTTIFYSMPTSVLSSTSQLNSFSIQATLSMSTSMLSSASQLDSTSSMHILSSRPHSSNSGHTPLSITTMPAVTSVVAATSFSHINSPSPSLSLPLMNCPETNHWESTKPGQWAHGTCYKRAFDATRYCNFNGSWGQINCSVSKKFIEIMSKINISHYVALESLSQQLNDFPAAQSIVLLDFIITNSVESDNETTQIVLDIASEIIQMASNKTDGVSIFSQLLITLDNAALNVGQDLSLSTDSIFLNVKQVQDFPDEEATAIDYDGNTLKLPNVVFNAVPATVASFVYKDLSVLSPTNDDELISPVISSTVRCNDMCNTNDFNESVTITFNLSDVQQSLNGRNISCVFWKFNNISNDSLPTGYWDKEGCTESTDVPTSESTVTCECNHLTHFAILLSPRSEEPSPVHTKILTIAGQILVPISLVCLLLVILTYTRLKSLWGMRNYIHIMLCSNLFVSQLLFLVGIEQTKHQSVCSGIAVVLQYIFLVSFMWMLMEGVVLYVTLVKVFIKYPKRYIIAFTLISYGVPAIYMMIIVPIGFLVNGSNQSHYLYYNDGHPAACWLNYNTHFIWSFIGPVIIIIIANIGFFVMSICIMRSHQRKKIHNKETDQIKHWIKVSLSLTIIMGIGWIGNVLFFSKELIFIAYIMTIFIAGQGIIIFILYVPLSSHVREAYGKWWRKKQANSLVLSKITFLTSNDSIMRDSKSRKNLTDNIYENYTMGTYEGGDKFKDNTIISNSSVTSTLQET